MPSQISVSASAASKGWLPVSPGMTIRKATAAGIMLSLHSRLPLAIWYFTISVSEKHRPVPVAAPTFLPTASSTRTRGSSQDRTVTISRLRPTPA